MPQRAKLSKRPVVVGFGPAGMFAALYLAQCGVRPIVLERGLDVDSRKEKVRTFWEKGILDTECNVQFGEGGAGTFSDGKLNTGVNNPLSKTVFEEFVRHGAPEEIMYEAKPHIGTDKLSETVKNIRKNIISLGGEVIFFRQFVHGSAAEMFLVQLPVPGEPLPAGVRGPTAGGPSGRSAVHPAERPDEDLHRGDGGVPAPDPAGRLVWDELFQYAGVVVEIWLSCGNRDQLGNCDALPLDHEKEKILVTSILCVTFSRKDAESSKPFQAYCFF